MAVPGPSVGALRGAVDLSALVARSAQPPAAAAAPSGPADPGAPSLTMEVGDADFGRVVELSNTVPVLVALTATWSTPSAELVAALGRIVDSLGGRMVLAVVDTDANPQLASAFQAQSVPTVAAVVAGRPVSLFTGTAPEDQLRQLLDQVLTLAEQNGVTGTVAAPEGAEVPDAPQAAAEPPLPPLHAEAYDAVDRQDYAEAARIYRTAIAQDPRDAVAVAALAQVELLGRLEGVSADEVRTAAAERPRDVEAALAAADLDLSGGHVEDAFARLLDVFGAVPAAERTPLRTRLLDFFEIVGADDPRVVAARRRLASLLY